MDTTAGGSARPSADGVVVLDGGLATELTAQGHDLSDRLWSARLLLTDPAAIEAAHLAYFRAGAQVAITASYQASIEGFAAVGLDRAEALSLIRSSVALADRARATFRAETGTTDRLLMAGSVGPFGAYLGDGSEYRGDYALTAEAFRAFHLPRMAALVEAGADLLAIETIPTIREAEALVDLLDDVGATAWLSYSCRDAAHTSAGEPIEAAIALGDHPRIVAVGVNCTAPRHMPELLARAQAVTGKPLIAYPNGGDRWDAVARTWVADDGGRYDPTSVATWRDLGAGWLGGCCGTGPAAIRALTVALADGAAA